MGVLECVGAAEVSGGKEDGCSGEGEGEEAKERGRKRVGEGNVNRKARWGDKEGRKRGSGGEEERKGIRGLERRRGAPERWKGEVRGGESER